MTDLHRLRFVAVADVYRAGRLERTGNAGTAFTYDQAYLAAGHPPVAMTLPLTGDPVTVPSGGVPPFFAGLLPLEEAAQVMGLSPVARHARSGSCAAAAANWNGDSRRHRRGDSLV